MKHLIIISLLFITATLFSQTKATQTVTPEKYIQIENGFLVDTHGDYPKVVRQTAREKNIPLVDLQLLTAGAVTAIGDESSKKI
jgi:ABC-type transporter MlaC component